MKRHYLLLKVLCLTLVGSILASSTAYAAETKTKIDNMGNNTVAITGIVEPTIVSADVTLTGAFAIKPNETDAAQRFISPTMKVVNTSVVPLKVTAVSLKHVNESPAVVSNTKYTDEQWKTLGVTETQSNIALGLLGANITPFWFADEAAQKPTNLLDLKSGQELDMTLQAKHGLSWAKGKQLDYELVFELEMVE
ncbi:hypothetical protein RBG61_12010 [Paludicola sp. MB14-C6]|uniref:hypothetical protein n=1 Tax=Paludihabitans sp. MB14-C6 TaxID=3070656 RepID=UPI0027DB6C3A|nr:hypothetical protein [Paludicola sp. MB14-C6]WMJ22708.1 hypothetical protein RBG61_12010 [Paludicola sp. MB14-C6]